MSEAVLVVGEGVGLRGKKLKLKQGGYVQLKEHQKNS
jgi:hypothetical protein